MGWDEKLFGLLYRRARGLLGTAARPPPPGSVATAELSSRLQLLASIIAGFPVDLRGLRLPERLEAGTTREGNETLALARVAHAATVLRLGLCWEDDATRALATVLSVPLVREAMWRELPGARPLIATANRLVLGALPAPSSEAERLVAQLLGDGAEPFAMPRDLEALAAALPRLPSELAGARYPVLDGWGLLPTRAQARSTVLETPLRAGAGAAGTERQAASKKAREARRVDLGEEKLDENPVTHSFEKVHTAEAYQGGKKRADGSDELAEHSDALDELDLDAVTRSGERARSVYRADLVIEGGPGDVAGEALSGAVAYDEWDEATRRYRPDWCAVREGPLPSGPGGAAWSREVLARYRPQLRAIRSDFARLAQSRVWRGRQADGPEVDSDAMVDRHASLRGGHQPPDRLYSNRRRHDRDLAVHLVLDASLSSDAWVANKRVLDVARESLAVLGEALREERIDTAAAVFRSHTRRDCRFDLVKEFDDPWDVAHGRLAALAPDGYTRIGPALRHATRRLERRGARRRLLVLVSDAKPTDYDRYEGRHGIADVGKAVEEARRAGVVVHALAIDASARAHLPKMFGRGGYEILPRPEVLPRALAALFGELMK